MITQNQIDARDKYIVFLKSIDYCFYTTDDYKNFKKYETAIKKADTEASIK